MQGGGARWAGWEVVGGMVVGCTASGEELGGERWEGWEGQEGGGRWEVGAEVGGGRWEAGGGCEGSEVGGLRFGLVQSQMLRFGSIRERAVRYDTR